MTRRPSITADPLFVVQRAIFARQLRACRATQGAAETGLIVEAGLSVIADFLRTELGPEAAFDVFARWTDTVSAPLLATSPGENQ